MTVSGIEMPRGRALACSDAARDRLARTIWGEARGEGFRGKLAVGWVARNRAEHPRWWGRDLEAVLLKPAQFSCWNADDPNAAKCLRVGPDDRAFVDCLAAAHAVIEGTIADPTDADGAGGADHYHVAGLVPAWSQGRAPLVAIGRHVFYRIRPPAIGDRRERATSGHPVADPRLPITDH
ncbi:MAG: cell wall hydrolase [Alphaproteobacteria bacterium]|nr:cell wall hydrolase [Alphaproteobacteria bacterium]